MSLDYISLFTGIGGFDIGFESGMNLVGYSEIDKYANIVLKSRFPLIPNYGDIKNVTRESIGRSIDLVCGGFPCQDLSLAGSREGLAGERSGLWWEFYRVIKEFEPRWVVIENVPGLLSSNKGRDMGTILGALAKLGYGYAYRVFDAQYFGVAQVRRRVFIVANLRNWSYPAQILFEPESINRNLKKSKGTGQDLTGALTARAGKDGTGNAQVNKFVAQALLSRNNRYDGESQTFITYNMQTNDGGSHKRKDRPNGGLYVNETDKSLTMGSTDQTLVVGDQDAYSPHGHYRYEDSEKAATLQNRENRINGNTHLIVGFNPKGDGGDAQENKTPTMRSISDGTNHDHQAGGPPLAVAWQNKQSAGEIRVQDDGKMPTLTRYMGTGGNNVPFVGVRRLMPIECERLQGFPDGWTDVGNSDTQRYKQLGNAVCVNVVKWIGNRIVKIDRGENPNE